MEVISNEREGLGHFPVIIWIMLDKIVYVSQKRQNLHFMR